MNQAMLKKALSLLSILLIFSVGTDLLAQETTQIGEAFNDCPVFVPTAFTPNGDSRNDFWGLQINPDCDPVEFNLRVYDRWGRLMYHSESAAREFWWDGTFEGEQLRSGVYMWQLDAIYIDPSDTERIDIQRKGTVALIR
jgi:gliding motility-associated-like protein